MPIKMRMIPAWAKIKDEILDARSSCTYHLTQHRRQPCINHRIDFASSTLHLYELLRPKIKYIAKADNGRYAVLKQRLDRVDSPLTNPNMKSFIKIFRLLEDACEELGVTKIEVPQDDIDEDNAMLDGHGVFG